MREFVISDTQRITQVNVQTILAHRVRATTHDLAARTVARCSILRSASVHTRNTRHVQDVGVYGQGWVSEWPTRMATTYSESKVCSTTRAWCPVAELADEGRPLLRVDVLSDLVLLGGRVVRTVMARPGVF